MVQDVISFGYPGAVLVLSIFLIYRLGLFGPGRFRGRGYLLAGMVMILAAAVVNLVQSLSAYPSWFLDSVYPVIDIGEFALLILGALVFMIGTIYHFSFLYDRDLEVSSHLEKLRLLDEIQVESRRPYPMMELLDRVLKSILSGFEESSGAIFLLNKGQRKFVLATSVGLTKDEVSLLEYYPYGRNVVTQAIEDEGAVVSSDFRSLGGKAQLAASRFHSILVVPLISGSSKLGALLLFSPDDRRYGREFISLIGPIAEWLAEKIEVMRLGRDLTRVRRERDTEKEQWETVLSSLRRVIAGDGKIPDPSELASRCVGLAGCDEVRLAGLKGDRLHFYGGTAGKVDFSESFRRALVSALARGKTVILNQEATDSEGNSFIARSALLVPLRVKGAALLLRNNNGRVQVTPAQLEMLEVIAAMAAVVVANSRSAAVAELQKAELQLVSDIMGETIAPDNPEKDIVRLIRRIDENLPRDYRFLFFAVEGDRLVARTGVGAGGRNINLARGEGAIGKAAASESAGAEYDGGRIRGDLRQYHQRTRRALEDILGDSAKPSFRGDYPIRASGQTVFMVTVFGFSGDRNESRQWHGRLERLIGLVNDRLAAARARISHEREPADIISHEIPADEYNQINNDLSALMGHCQLSMRTPGLPETATGGFESILNITEGLAERFRKLYSVNQESPAESSEAVSPGTAIGRLFEKSRISGNLYLIEGRPWTLSLKLEETPELPIEPAAFSRFMTAMTRLFVSTAATDETISIHTYGQGRFVYIDFSKHRENFPPVEPVFGFGQYDRPGRLPREYKEAAVSDILEEWQAAVAIDRHGQRPSYLSVRLPLEKETADAGRAGDGGALKILAVDDQAVILELLAAMCQSLGYRILTARDGREGLEKFESTHPDIVITDLAMPGISGLELAGRIKAQSPRTPIILITGWGVPIEEEKIKKAGIDFVLHKPFRLEQLSDVIGKVKLSGISG